MGSRRRNKSRADRSVTAQDGADWGAQQEPLQHHIANGSRESVRLLRKGAAEWTVEEATRPTQLEQLDATNEA